MDLALALINIPICLLVLVRCARSMVNGLNGLLPILLAIFVGTNCIGLSVIKVILVNGALKTGNVDLPFDSAYFVWQCLAHWVFLLTGALVLRFGYSSPEIAVGTVSLTLQRRFLGIAGLSFFGGVVFYLPYMFFGPGFELLQGSQLFYADFDEASDHRREMMRSLVAGQGYFRAQIAANGLFPLTAFFVLWSSANRWLGLSVSGCCFAMSLGFALCLRQKAPLVVTCLCYLGLVLFSGEAGAIGRTRLVEGARKYWVLLAGAAMLILGGLYWAMEGGDVQDAGEKVLLRNFVTPAAASHMWFYVFPERFEYRGLLESLHIVPASVSKDSITIEDVALRATGAEFMANASLIAIGWSGYGMAGVALVACCFYGVLVMLDMTVRKMPVKSQMGIIALSLSSILQLTSGSFSDFIVGGSLLAVVAVCCVYKFTELNRNSHASRS